jgi:hypothetical protein
MRRVFCCWIAAAATLFGSSPAGATCGVVPGDINGDGSTNVADALCIVKGSLWWLQGAQEQPPACLGAAVNAERQSDLNCDRSVDVADALVAVQLALSNTVSEILDGDGDKCVDACQTDSDGDGDPDILDCAPLAASVFSGAVEVCNGADDDCDGQVDGEALDATCDDGDVCTGVESCVVLPAGLGLRINEIMAQPSMGAVGQWVELLNVGAAPINVAGYTLGSAAQPAFVFPSTGPIWVPAGGTRVIATNSSPALNGGLLYASEVGTLNLGTISGVLVLRNAAAQVLDSAVLLPAVPGASQALSHPAAPGGQASSWGASTDFYAPGNQGTPGSPNLDVAEGACVSAPCQGPGCPRDGDADGVLDPCDPCPVDNPDDANGDNVCDSGAACPCGMTGPGCANLALTVLQPGFSASIVSNCLPVGANEIEYAADGLIYGTTNSIQGPGGDVWFQVQPNTGIVSSTTSFPFPVSDLYRVQQSPPAFGGKLYVVDWWAGAPNRIWRWTGALTGGEVVHSTDIGAPFGTSTGGIAFSVGGDFGLFAYHTAQGASATVWRIGPGAPASVSAFATIPGAADMRGCEFGPGGAFGNHLYVITSSVINGFTGAPGGIHRVFPNGSSQVFVPQSAGLEFGIDILFDKVGTFGGDLLYRDASARTYRVNASGAATLMARVTAGAGQAGAIQLPDGSLWFIAQRALVRLAPTP